MGNILVNEMKESEMELEFIFGLIIQNMMDNG